ncbi:hypothetical protein GCM10023149_36200 [Mucilaginibacter gynuensis]|uniref:Protein-glutamine gamma-glutamyltransferase-like C-terminal domain-containing protein n=1 Tax=Mucilaginibacter gynuensis TaxID=1302236 RepID=A0ABP8GW62_9SPHI
MRRLIPFLLLTLLLVLPCSFAWAVDKNPPAVKKVIKTVKKTPAILHADSAAVKPQKFNDASLEQYASQRDFRYDDGATEGPTWWDRFWDWFGAPFRGFHMSPEAFIILKYTFLIIAIAGLLFVILKLVGIDITGVFGIGPKKASVPYHETLENIHEIDFDAEIELAVTQGNYRLAVRLLYLKCLKQLSDKNLIDWQIDKTNTAYFYELQDADKQQAFGSLTRRFEYVWYGNFIIDEPAYKDINVLFQQFKQQIA